MRARKNMDRIFLMNAAMGKTPCDLTVENVQYVNVFTGEIYPACVDIAGGYIVRVRMSDEPEEMPAKEKFDGKNHFLLPGFVDTHMHVESTMMIPENVSRAIVPWGTTTICTDPHEIANVMGIEGVRFMLENAEKSSLRQFILAPSCVPAVPGLEYSGAEFKGEEIGKILDMEKVIGIAELMDYVGITNGSERMQEIIGEGIKRDMFLQGHAPLVRGKQLAAYRIGGPVSDHESETAEEIIEKMRTGMHINLRASSLVNHMDNLAEGIKKMAYHDFVSICTDDVHAEDLLTLGHVNQVVRLAIEKGLDPIDVIRMATLNAAREMNLEDVGAAAPGYLADFQLVEALDGRCPRYVFIEGELVASEGKYLKEEKQDFNATDINTVKISWIRRKEDFSLWVKNPRDQKARVNVMIPLDEMNILREVQVQTLPVKEGKVDISDRKDLAFVCVCNRHGRELKTIAVMENFGLKEGAVATTISHDSHNMVIVYRKEEDALCAAARLQSAGGGMCVVKEEKVLSCVELPVAGLMSPKECKDIADEMKEYKNAFCEVCSAKTPLMSTSIMSLTALPGVIVTDCGLIDGNAQKKLKIIL